MSAACRCLPKSLFFPNGAAGAAGDDAAAAKVVCAGCPVRRSCLIFALQTNQQHGVWGGLAEHERLGLLRRYRRDGLEAALAAAEPLSPAG